MNNGLNASIIEYRSAKDVDVEFENGTVVTGRHYSAFKNGQIRCPSIRGKSKKIINRTGETLVMSNSLRAAIIRYRHNMDIDVLFENGCIARNRDYYKFKSGAIKCPMKITQKSDYAEVENPNTGTKFTMDIEDLHILGDTLWNVNKVSGYVVGNDVLLHRLIANCPDDKEVDHKNRVKTDNRKSNLRISSRSENSQNVNLRKNNTSGYTGIWLRKDTGKWTARIIKDGNIYNLGSFESKENAVQAYNEAAITLYGEFAKINEIHAAYF